MNWENLIPFPRLTAGAVHGELLIKNIFIYIDDIA